MKFIDLNIAKHRKQCEIEIEEFNLDGETKSYYLVKWDEGYSFTVVCIVNGEQVPVPIPESAKIIDIVQNLLSL